MSAIASALVCSRTARLRGRPSEPLMFVWAGRKFVPLISSVRTRLAHLSINFAKYGLMRIGPMLACFCLFALSSTSWVGGQLNVLPAVENRQFQIDPQHRATSQ